MTNKYAYVYFNADGTLREFIIDPSIKQGNQGINKLRIYWFGAETFTSMALSYINTDEDNPQWSEPIPVDYEATTFSVPVIQDYDPKYFNYGEQYEGYEISLDNILNKNGNLALSFYIYDNNKAQVAYLGIITLFISETGANYQSTITKSQYYILLDKCSNLDLTDYLKKVNDASTILKINEIDNINGNALVRYKPAENKNVFGGVGYNAVIMGANTRPYYSSDGSDFTGVELALLSDLGNYFEKGEDGSLDLEGANINNIRNITASGDAINIKSTDASQVFSVDLYNSGSGEYADIKVAKAKGNTLKQLTLSFLNNLIDIDVQTTDADKHTLYSDIVEIADDGSVDFMNGAKSSIVPQNNNDLTNKEYVDNKVGSLSVVDGQLCITYEN